MSSLWVDAHYNSTLYPGWENNDLVTCFCCIWRLLFNYINFVDTILAWLTVCVTIGLPFLFPALHCCWDRVLRTTYAHPVLLTLRLPAFLFLCHIHLGSGCGPGEPSVTQSSHIRTKTAQKKKRLLFDTQCKTVSYLVQTTPYSWCI